MNESAETAIRDLWTRYFAAYEGLDAKGCAGVFAENAWVVSPWGPPAQGRDAIEDAHLTWFEEGERNKTAQVVDLQVAGPSAVCLLRFEADIPDGTRVAGINLNVLRETASGGWEITHSSLNDIDINEPF
ncbi:SgcJ/EcaC family oxidoreductase [Marimonas sp. MJW-29]|uniref:SgcJ/EcaC family oxidoreductase n=1 Tax=Sulfitobacter sediminis TaxID=3234186 RepID=A0ABV3RMH6_9RHOB